MMVMVIISLAQVSRVNTIDGKEPENPIKGTNIWTSISFKFYFIFNTRNIIYCKTWHNINVMLKSVLRRIKTRHTRARDILYLPVIRAGF